MAPWKSAKTCIIYIMGAKKKTQKKVVKANVPTPRDLQLEKLQKLGVDTTVFGASSSLSQAVLDYEREFADKAVYTAIDGGGVVKSVSSS
jgi:hypothetical protein